MSSASTPPGVTTIELSAVPLLQSLASPDIEQLLSLLRRRRYARGEVIFLTGDAGINLCIIESGRVKLTLTSPDLGREVALDYLGPGDVFGELALLDGEPRSADAIAVEPTRLLLLSRDDFRAFLMSHPAAALDLLADMSRRLRRDAQVIQDAAFLDVPARLARVALRLAEPGPDGMLRTPTMSQADLAALVITTRATLNKFLGMLTDQGLLRWESGRVVVVDKERLQRRIY
jgi:CRP/FNR family transcriptional regulator, cyclic AMP receptor protein